MITAPMRPTAELKEPEGMVGTKSPYIRSPKLGATMKKLTKKQTAMMPIRKAKKSYTLLDKQRYLKLSDTEVVDKEEGERVNDCYQSACPVGKTEEDVQCD